MTVEWIMAVIVALYSYWGPSQCDEGDERCTARNTERATELQRMGDAINGCSSFHGFDPFLIVDIIGGESSFLQEPCHREIPLDKIVERIPLEGQRAEETIRWTCGSRVCSRDSINVEEIGDKLSFWVCPAGELGMMQIVPGSQWVRSGHQIEGTDVVLSREPRARQSQILDRVNNIWIGCEELASHRDNYISRLDEDEDRTTTEYANLTHWYNWVGWYNTGRQCDAADRYRDRRVRDYLEICNVEVTGSEGVKPLRDYWEECGIVQGLVGEED